MRKITFIINDYEYFKKLYANVENLGSILEGVTSFKAIYTLTGKDNVERYNLTDDNGKKLNINDLNGYQKGVVLNECYQYFNGKRNFEGGLSIPCGVIDIKEEIWDGEK